MEKHKFHVLTGKQSAWSVIVWGHILCILRGQHRRQASQRCQNKILSDCCSEPWVPPAHDRALPFVAGGWQQLLDDEDNPAPLGHGVLLHHHYITPQTVQEVTDEPVQV